MEKTNKSLRRAIALLDLLAQRPMTLTELSKQIGIAPSGTLKILRTFIDVEMVRKGDSRRYCLAANSCRFGGAYMKQNSLMDIALPIMRKLSTSYETRVVLAILEGIEQVNLLMVDRPLGVLDELPIKVGPCWPQATGQVLLAHAEPDIVHAHLQKYPLFVERITENSPEEFEKVLLEIKSSGFAVVATPETGINMIASPVRNMGERVIAAIGTVSYAADNLDTRIDSLVTAADKISRELGAKRRK